MEIKLIHILGPVFATVAMFFYGRALVDRDKGRQVNILPTLILIGGAIDLHFFHCEWHPARQDLLLCCLISASP
jgi:hypothetical protein